MRFFIFLALVISLVTIAKVYTMSLTEVRVKVDDLFEKLQYPRKLSKIRHFGSEGSLNAAVDFDKYFNPKMIQFSIISERSKAAINFDMKYNPTKSKASLSINLKDLKPGIIEFGEDYRIELFVSDRKGEVESWDLGVLKSPLSINYNIPDIEDHFYKQDELFAAGPKQPTTINPFLPIIGLIMTVAFPLWLLKQLWPKTGAKYLMPSYFTDKSVSRVFPFFSATIIALVLLIVGTWSFFNVFQMLAGLAILGPTAFILGHLSLKALVNSESSAKSE